MDMAKQVTGTSRGLAKGDWCLNACGWVCRILSDVRTFAPCCEVWGFEHEAGSVYAAELTKITESQAYAMITKAGYDPNHQYYKGK
jgi:hypothetical protein